MCFLLEGHCEDEVSPQLPATVGTRRRRKTSGRRSACFDPANTKRAATESMRSQDPESRLSETQEVKEETRLDEANDVMDTCPEPDNAQTLPQRHAPEQPKKRGRPPKQTAPKQTAPKETPQESQPQPQALDASGPVRGRLLQTAPHARRVVAAPLKKPWENSRPRARSKSRDRTGGRAPQPPPSHSQKHQAPSLNSTLNMNDTFDFDCEEAVHVTPFKAGPKTDQRSIEAALGPPEKDAQVSPQEVAQDPPLEDTPKTDSSPSEDEEDDSLYIPTSRACRKQDVHSPPRRARSKRRAALQETKQGRTGRPRTSGIKPQNHTGKTFLMCSNGLCCTKLGILTCKTSSLLGILQVSQFFSVSFSQILLYYQFGCYLGYSFSVDAFSSREGLEVDRRCHH